MFVNATNAIHFGEGNLPDWIDLEYCTMTTTHDVVFDSAALTTNRVRKQCDNTAAFNITKSGRTSIALFAPATYLDESKPQVSIASPSGGSTVTGTVTVTTYTYDLGGMQSVALYADGVLVTSTNVSPYTLSWNSAAVANGKHDLYLIGYDTAGNSNESAHTTVFVQNP
jgi:hypothetical protein